jgi:hypothetical protein
MIIYCGNGHVFPPRYTVRNPLADQKAKSYKQSQSEAAAMFSIKSAPHMQNTPLTSPHPLPF